MSSQHSQAAAVRQAQNTIGTCHVAATALRFHGHASLIYFICMECQVFEDLTPACHSQYTV